MIGWTVETVWTKVNRRRSRMRALLLLPCLHGRRCQERGKHSRECGAATFRFGGGVVCGPVVDRGLVRVCRRGGRCY